MEYHKAVDKRPVKKFVYLIVDLHLEFQNIRWSLMKIPLKEILHNTLASFQKCSIAAPFVNYQIFIA